MDAIAGFDPFKQILFPRILGSIDEIQAGLIESYGIERRKDFAASAMDSRKES